MVPGDIKRAKTVNGFKNAYKNTERPWWRTPRKAKKRKTACGETTFGARHILRGPTWAIGCNHTRTRTRIRPSFLKFGHILGRRFS
jgi:hypothetical protein